jgi:hypothetical protein
MIMNGCDLIKSKINNLADDPLCNEINAVWAASQCMHMLTTSQLQNYQIDCDKLKPVATPFVTVNPDHN